MSRQGGSAPNALAPEKPISFLRISPEKARDSRQATASSPDKQLARVPAAPGTPTRTSRSDDHNKQKVDEKPPPIQSGHPRPATTGGTQGRAATRSRARHLPRGQPKRANLGSAPPPGTGRFGAGNKEQDRIECLNSTRATARPWASWVCGQLIDELTDGPALRLRSRICADAAGRTGENRG